MGHLAVEQDELENILTKLSAIEDLYRGNTQALLKDMLIASVNEIGMMRQVGSEALQAVCDEDR